MFRHYSLQQLYHHLQCMYGGLGGYGASGGSYGGYGGMGTSGGMGSYGSYGTGYNPYGARPGVGGEQERRDNPEQNKGKMIFEEWFKMVGGLRSIIELGMAGIAIANFYNYASGMVGKLVEFIKSVGARVLSFLHRKFAAKMLSRLAEPGKRMKVIKSLVVNFVRAVAFLLLCLSAKLRGEIKRQNQQKLQKLQREFERCKSGEMQPTKVEEGECLDGAGRELMLTNANL